ncbi:hypothetical protein F2Q70_00036161 [Brassica cretica]|uniref:Uncharacterized protein n=1 Tax=Brassica cretica TaxID=69181 RepID=A0A8S9JVJ9_BRACR|nr:hypothetical protein F2Q70_00036161 [Brassica cretica]
MSILVTWCGFWASNGLEICLAHVLESLSIDTNSALSIDSPSLLDSFVLRGRLTTLQSLSMARHLTRLCSSTLKRLQKTPKSPHSSKSFMNLTLGRGISNRLLDLHDYISIIPAIPEGIVSPDTPQRFSLSEVFLFPGKGVVPGTGPGILHSGEAGCLLAGTQRPVSCLWGITCALKSTGVAHSQQASLRQDIAPVILRSWVPHRPEPYSEPEGGPIPLFQTGVWCYRTADFLSKMEKLWDSDGVLEPEEPGALMFPEEELKGLMCGNRSGGWWPFG